ncbi:glycosyltransferase family A protein [Dokdonia sp. Dokd-P16]|uniref:glycosyltransferase family A protein n=1 Tax=Dokdonia sp. Dokd-P16 TaxID=2173169 RepID=UPI0013A5A7B4|nr:glycosyltransferase family A protein [Dokdonia sp. Dokd-P16]
MHRVIIPLYVPHEMDYYKDAYEVFLLCLKSLRITSNSNIKISVISNGSCDIVNTRLLELYHLKEINELIIERDSIGKLNSILKVLRTCTEPYVTVSDADILFSNDWENQVLKVFKEFPKAAAVSPMPVFRTQNHHTSNILFDYLFSKNMRFTKVKNPEALTLFAKSIGWPRLDNHWKDVILTISSNSNVRAVVGCNHSVVTYNRSIFKKIPDANSKFQLGGDSEGNYLDKPALYFDGYRLSTEDNFAFHMGNFKEEWMTDAFKNLKSVTKTKISHVCEPLKEKVFLNFLKNYLFKKIMSFPTLRKFIFASKGLSINRLDLF